MRRKKKNTKDEQHDITECYHQQHQQEENKFT